MTSTESPTPDTDAATAGKAGLADERLSEDEVFHLLQNQRRRDVVRYLSDTDGTVSMRDVAEQVAAWEHDTSVRALSSDQRQRVYIPLYQNHLPKLDDDGVINYNQSRGTVERTPTADQLEAYLVDEHTTPEDAAPGTALPPDSSGDQPEGSTWTDAYLGATGLGGLLFLAAVAGLPGLTTLLAATLMLVTFATVTLAHTVSESDSLPF